MNQLLSRSRMSLSSIALVENLRGEGDRAGKSPASFSPDFQVCLPYRGLFVWHVGQDDVVGDANQVLFVSSGESFSLSKPVSGGFGELIITPDAALLAELASGHDSLDAHPLFRRRSQRLDAGAQELRTRFLYLAARGDLDSLSADERIVGLLRSAMKADAASGGRPGRATRRLILRTKEFLEAHMTACISLADVARHAGASPAYLTDVFRRVEGAPLHRYLVQLRLARALVDLPGASDLTSLALALGFSSHSHFTAAFRRAFGCTPSQCRESLRKPAAAPALPLNRRR
ncbi:MAG TPA: AraC family transcriptional regulator [Steroidobacteraceae bacterium]|nr:AraC family transcriptional regulator [Steroidobacteraceae bacterium]